MEETAQRSPVSLAECAVLITGGTSGVGLATALKFAQSGVGKIAIVGRDHERGHAARQAIADSQPGIDVQYLSGDANKATEAARLCSVVCQRFGSIDVLVNSTVGPAAPALLHQIPIEDIERILLAQMLGPLLMSGAALPYMREKGSGSIINVSSDAGKLATPGESVIGAAMAGIIMFSRTLAVEAKPKDIR